MATFNIIEWALREIRTAVKNGEDRTPVHYHLEVVWDDYTAAFRPKFLGKMDWRPLSSFCSGRVVGNKWDTPNLIDMKYER